MREGNNEEVGAQMRKGINEGLSKSLHEVKNDEEVSRSSDDIGNY